MKKMLVVMLILALVVPVIAVAPVFAAQKVSKGVTNVGNATCPVSGDPVSGKNFVVHKGKRYGLCCPACKKPFLKNPEQYIAKLEAAKQPTALPQAIVTPIPQAQMKDMKAEKKTT